MQYGAEIGTDQVLAMLEDQQHHLARLNAFSFQLALGADRTLEQLAYGDRLVFLTRMLQGDGDLIRSIFHNGFLKCGETSALSVLAFDDQVGQLIEGVKGVCVQLGVINVDIVIVFNEQGHIHQAEGIDQTAGDQASSAVIWRSGCCRTSSRR